MSPHEPLVDSPSKLAAIAAASLILPLGLVVVAYFGIEQVLDRREQSAALTPERIARNLRPVGEVYSGDTGRAKLAAAAEAAAAAAAPVLATAAASPGETIYGGLCMSCHVSGAAGAPMLTDAAAWAPRLVQGEDLLVQHVITGKGAMPPRGGNPALSDADIRLAVQFMIGKAGG